METIPDDAKYSSVLPWIGFYSALATAISLALMCYGFYCKFRGISFKYRVEALDWPAILMVQCLTLSMDPTTPMNGNMEQLVKLMGSSLASLLIAQSTPSSMIAPTYTAVTYILSIGAQIYTGLIHTFVVEHVICLCIIVLVLKMRWISHSLAKIEREHAADDIRKTVTSGEGNLLGRLKRCFVRSVISNPVLVFSTTPCSFIATTWSTISIFIIGEAAIRKRVHKQFSYSTGFSEYGWSTGVVLTFDMAYMFVFLYGIRFSLFRCMDLRSSVHLLMSEHQSFLVLIISHRRRTFFHIIHRWVMIVLAVANSITILSGILVVSALENTWRMARSCLNGEITHGRAETLVDELIQRKAEEEIESFIQEQRRNHPLNLINILWENHHSPIGLDHNASCLSAAVLVRSAFQLLPSHRTEHLVKALEESFHIIFMIEKRTKAKYFKQKRELEFAKVVWNDWDLDSSFASLDTREFISRVLNRPQGEFPLHFIFEENHTIISNINPGGSSSEDEIYSNAKQLLVAILHQLLCKLPIAICKEVTHTPLDECAERIKCCVKSLCAIEPLEGVVNWELPYGLSSLITPVNAIDGSGIGTRSTGASDFVALDVIEGELSERGGGHNGEQSDVTNPVTALSVTEGEASEGGTNKILRELPYDGSQGGTQSGGDNHVAALL